MQNKINLQLSSQLWDSKEISAIKTVISSNQFTMSNNVKRFENQFARYFKTKYATMFNSG